MPLIEQSAWWVVPAFLLSLFMIHAMLECTATLLWKRPRTWRNPLDGAGLRERLLALNESNRPYRLVAAKDCDLELHWDVVEASWYELFAKVKLTTKYRARMLFDESRHELRWNEYLRTSNFFLGFDGWRPCFSWSIRVQSGYINVIWRGRAYGILSGFPPRIGRVYDFSLDTVQAKKEISGVANRSGWTFRPVIWWFQATRRGHRVLQALVPAPLKQWSPRRFWGIAYPVSYVVAVGYLSAITGAWDWRNLTVVLGISV